jgi:ATP-binding cassette, subfamily B, bacterial
MVVILTIISPIVGVIVFVYIVASSAALIRVRNRVTAEAAVEQGAMADLYGGIEEQLVALEDLRANGGRNHAISQFTTSARKAFRAGVIRQVASMRVWGVVTLIISWGGACSIALSALLVRRNDITIGTAFTLFQYVNMLHGPLDDIIHQLDVVQKAGGASHRVAALFAHTTAIEQRSTTTPPSGPLSVEFRNVSFRYRDDEGDDDELVLNDVSLTIAAGTSLGVVGRTGGGKTTLGRQLLRLIEPTEGTVFLGGVPIGDIAEHELRRRVALVPQDVHLLSGTVRDNTSLFDPHVNDDQVVDALIAVGLSDLANDLDRSLADGSALSAGEAQLLALARVWLRDPDLIVLDEATSRVDPATEARIEAAIARLLDGRTAIVIAHRLSTLSALDAIAVVDAGRIIEHGSHDELASSDGRFAALLALAGDQQGASDPGVRTT